MTIHAGKLTEQIVIQSASGSQDSYGEPAENWSTISVGTCWAQVIAQSGKEFVADARETADHSVAFLIRHRTDVTTQMRVQWESRNYEIQSIDHERINGMTVLKAREVKTRA